MDNLALFCISPIDGRYQNQLKEMQVLFSEFNLMNFRLLIEIEWLQLLAAQKQLTEIKPLSKKSQKFLTSLTDNFKLEDAIRIKEIEGTTSHDVKAIEYFLKEKCAADPELKNYLEFIHFGCTSDDINNLAYALILKITRDKVILPYLEILCAELRNLAHKYAAIPMLARTHGQPATPTTVGKELANFVARLKKQIVHLTAIEISGKINGAVGNYNAHSIAYPNLDWPAISKKFVTMLGLKWGDYSTQIEPHDYIAELSNSISLINTILISLCRDTWGYIALNYFKQNVKPGEVGSSTMPHKVNPIDFENAEGNFGIANALFTHFAAKLPISRFQRDLSDSTVMRNLGVAVAHTVLAYKSLSKGLRKIAVNQEKLAEDLDAHWEILGEAIQTVMRKYQVKNAYEKLKELTHNQQLDQKTMQNFVKKLKIPKAAKKRLLKLTPANYLGKAVNLARNI